VKGLRKRVKKRKRRRRKREKEKENERKKAELDLLYLKSNQEKYITYIFVYPVYFLKCFRIKEANISRRKVKHI